MDEGIVHLTIVKMTNFKSVLRIAQWEHSKQMDFIDDYMSGEYTGKQLQEKYQTKNASTIHYLLSIPKFSHLKDDIMSIRKEMMAIRAEDKITDKKLEESRALELVNIQERYFKMGRMIRGETSDLDPIAIDLDDLKKRFTNNPDPESDEIDGYQDEF